MRKSVSEIIKNGKMVKSGPFTLHYRSTSDGVLKIGFKIFGSFGNVVIRNRIKRQIRKFIREHLKNGDYFIRITADLQHLTEKDIEEEWNKIEKKISL